MAQFSQPSELQQRSRAIKGVMERAFGKGKVRIRMGRGTSWGWAHIHIAYRPRSLDEAHQLNLLCVKLLDAAKVPLGTHWPDDGFNRECKKLSIHFERVEA
jgi:hypothetical protein